MAVFPPRLTASAVAFVMLAAACSGAPDASAAAPGPDHASHRVQLRSSDHAATWRGSQRVAFTNEDDAPITRIWLRLWANGVQGCAPRAIRVTGIEGGTKAELRRDCTALAIDLDASLASGQRGRVRFDLRIEVPERNDRFGTHRGITLLGGALPVLAVLDEGGWHLDPYVDLGESFYSLVATYRVALDVPGSLATATTGVLDATSHHGDRERRVYRASDVRDFAIAAGALRRVVGHAGGTRIVVWYHPDVTSAATAERVLGDARASMRTFSAGFGAYPYPEVDVVASGFTTFGGMEYPQIVFSNPDRYTVAHELAHQWWWGIVGNDEFAEPWLDESLATWSMYLPYAPWRNCGTFDWPSPSARLTNDMAYWRDHPGDYGTIYGGGGCMFADLAHEIGVERLVQALGDYAADRWLGVTTADDLRSVLDAAAADAAPDLDMAAFWDRWRAA